MGNIYAQRARQGFSTIKPFQLKEPIATSEPEQEDNTLANIGNIIGAAVGGVKGAMGKGKAPTPAVNNEGIVDPRDAPEYQSQEQASSTQQSPYDLARGKYEEAINAPVKKMKPWQDALYKGAVIFSNAMNPKNQLPVQGVGRAIHNRDVSRAFEAYAPQRQLEEQRQADAYKQAQIANIGEDNRRQQAELERKTKADENKNSYYEGILKDKAQGRELSEIQINDLKDYRTWLMQNGDKNTAARIRQIDERLKDYDLDREEKMRHNRVTEGQANTRIANTKDNQQATQQRLRDQLDRMDERGKQSSVTKALTVWQKQNPSATPEAIAAARAAIEKTVYNR